MSLIIRRPLTPEQQQKLAEKVKPNQEDINQATNDLIWGLMQRVEELEAKKSTSKKR